MSHHFWARQAAAAERGAHSWLAGRPALMSFPHGPEFPTRHDHTGKTLPRPPPPQLPPSHRKEKGGGNVVEAAELASPGAQWGPAAWPPGGLRLGRPAHRERLRNRAVLVKMRAGSSSGGGKGRRPERPRVLGHIPASLAPIHPPPPCVRPRGECGWRATLLSPAPALTLAAPFVCSADSDRRGTGGDPLTR